MIEPTLVLALWLAAAPAAAEAPTSGAETGSRARRRDVPARPAALDPAALERAGAIVGDVYVVAGDVFDLDDPEQDRVLFRVANRLHRETRPGVIRRQLLFTEGDPFSRRLVEESERLLRANRYLYDAQIRPVRLRGNVVDLEVVTRDVWTLSGGASVSRSGGENATRFELQDTSFLGSGKDVTIEQSTDVDRTSMLLRYRDPNVAGRRVGVEAAWGDNSDGHHRKLYVERPFYSLDTRWAASLRVIVDDRVDGLYHRGQALERLRLDRAWAEAYGGFSRGLVDGRVVRFTFGATYVDSAFADAGDAPITPPPDVDVPGGGDPFSPIGLPPDVDPGWEPPPGVRPGWVPDDRRLVYPWVALEWLEDAYVEAHDVDHIGRTEDRYLGRHVYARLGWSSTGLGSDRDALVFRGQLDDVFRIGRGKLLETTLKAGGRWRSEGFEDVLVSSVGRFMWRNFGDHMLVVRLGADFAYRLDGERQLLLGGDSGLRGYPLRYQDGDRRFLLTVEQRFYTDWNPFELFHVGAAVFADIGRSWFDGGEIAGAGSEVLRDVGFGLRLSSARAGRGTMTHLDVAFPLDGDDSIEGVQWLITTSESF